MGCVVNKANTKLVRSRFVLTAVAVVFSLAAAQAATPDERAAEILSRSGTEGGLVVHVGCGDGTLTAALRAGHSYLVHGLDADAADVAAARERIRSRGLYGPICIDRLVGAELPYIDNLVNLVVAEDLGAISLREVMRVLRPGGAAYVKKGGKWTKRIKPLRDGLDEWTHYLHDASNNAVSHDTIVGPPKRLQWLGSPRWARHHDRMSSFSAAVSSGGRVFYIMDEASAASILIPPRWTLIARDAFNGTVLWKRPLENWHTHLWPLKSGPVQLPRRLLAVGDRVYVTLGYDAPLTALDAATGEVVKTYEGTKATEEAVLSDGVLFTLVNKDAKRPAYADLSAIKHAYGGAFWNDTPEYDVTAVRAGSGQVLWSKRYPVLPVTLAVDARRVFFHNGRSVVCLNRNTGEPLWRSEPVARTDVLKSFFSPTLIVYEGVVLFSGGETAGQQTGSWYMEGKDTMTALSAETGEVLWSAYHPPSGYRSPEDLVVANDLVWTGETTSGRAVGVFTGRDPLTGEVKCEFPPDVDTYWFHHRCYRGKATDRYLLMSRTGVEFVDLEHETWTPNHWVRGACLYGVMPANGLLYAPQHPCACYLESKLFGFNALAPAADGPRIGVEAGAGRLEKGPAYDSRIVAASTDRDWPTYRSDPARSGRANAPVSASLAPTWQTTLDGNLTSPVVAGGRLFVASIDTHTVHALDAGSGRKLWAFTAGGRVDSPPTIHEGRVLFGSADGWVYCLHAADGAMVWRFRAAPIDQRTVVFEQLESVWPVHGSVLVRDGVLYCVAGRSMFLDDGLRLLRLDPKTGRLLSETVMDESDPGGEQDIQAYVSWLNMPTAMPDILSSQGDRVYMRSQPLRLDGTRLPLEAMPNSGNADKGAPPPIQKAEHAHLFCPTGFLDDSYWHRTYWMYGSQFISGWCGYFLAGKAAPAGRILVFDEETVYGFGRKPKYYRWTTPIEHQLFAADKDGLLTAESRAGDAGDSLIRVPKSDTLNPAGKPLTVEAWIKADKAGGVIVARGGSSLGYTLYLKNGRPSFALRIGGEVAAVAAEKDIVGRWTHVAGVLTADREMYIYVDGQRAGTATVPGLLGGDPAEAMELAADEGSIVGDYAGPFAFKGAIDEVRIYHRALGDAEIGKHASSFDPRRFEMMDLVLWYSFDDGRAADVSGHKNNGAASGAVVVDGKVGRALRFSGRVGSSSDFAVEHEWAHEVPLVARALVLAGRTLFVAGPPDYIDEEQAFRQIDDPATLPKLEKQAAAFAGEQGALLMAVSADDGDQLARYELDSPPVFDGMAAADGRLYIVTMDGRVLCLAPNRQVANVLSASGR